MLKMTNDANMTFGEQAWQAIAPIRQKILELPLLEALSNGTLPPDVFRQYILQDSLYLRDYARCLAIIAAKAPDGARMTRFLGSAQTAVQVEQGLHAGILTRFGLASSDIENALPAPSPLAYISFILSTVQASSYAVGLSAILPCFWIYWDVGEVIKARPATEGNPYQTWIDTYGDPSFAAGAREVIRLTDEAAATASPADRELMMKTFVRASQYEWMFWDSAWRLESWPV